MKHSTMTRLLSFMLVLVMVLGMIPVDTIHVHATESQHTESQNTESQSQQTGTLEGGSQQIVDLRGSGVTNDQTMIEMDYDHPGYLTDDEGDLVYDDNGNMIPATPDNAMTYLSEKGRTTEDGLDYDYYWSNENVDPETNQSRQWRQVFDGDYKASGGKFRSYLESSDPDDKYIVLMESMMATVKGSDYDVIEITSDKVLDLNGHTIQLYDKRNGTTDQSSDIDDHMSYMFKITKGATLTIIDSYLNVTITGDDGEISRTGGFRSGGRIYANGYMINHQKWDFWYYTHRDIFLVDDGNLVIYGGEFQAGRQKDQFKTGFSWAALKEVVGDTVSLGVAVFEYASGISAATAIRNDTKLDLYPEDQQDTGDGEDTSQDKDGANKKKDGSGGTEEKKNDTPATAGKTDEKDVEKAGGKKDQTVAQKQTDNNKKDDKDKQGDKSKENKADDKKAAKNDKNTKMDEVNKGVATAVLDKDKIMGMVDSAFDVGQALYDLFAKDNKTRATACIQGTVARVGGECTMVIYGGNFIGHGSTPNVRNAVIEVFYNPLLQKVTAEDDPRYGKNQGGMVYVFDGTFSAYTGANVFSFFQAALSQTKDMYILDENGEPTVIEDVKLAESESFGIKEVRFDPDELAQWQEAYAALPTDARKEYEALETEEEREAYTGLTDAQKKICDEQPERVDTGNIMVRGGTFRCYYEPSMMAILMDDNEGQLCPDHNEYHGGNGGDCDDYDHRKFSGTRGSVNLGVESFDENMIRDGRIQIVDVYGFGKLVLLDGGDPIEDGTDSETSTESTDPTTETTDPNVEPEFAYPAPENTYSTDIKGMRTYRLFVGDQELREMGYLEVYPNDSRTNSTYSFALKNYWGTGQSMSDGGWVTDDENIRAPYSSNEKYFEYIYDDVGEGNSGSTAGVYIMPELNLSDPFAAGEDLAQSDVWYYTLPKDYKGNVIGEFSYTDMVMNGTMDMDDDGLDDYYQVSYNRTRKEGDGWSFSEYDNMGAWKGRLDDKTYSLVTDESYKINMKYFTYKIYRVDPLTRENINESDEWSANEPLIEIKYGASNESVKCKITLKDLEPHIAKAMWEKHGIQWDGYQSGELFRVVFTVEERVGFGYLGTQTTDGEIKFAGELDTAKAEASILFRCSSVKEQKDRSFYNSDGELCQGYGPDWTPLQFASDSVVAGDYANVQLVNGQTSLVDWESDRIFDIYYQWYLLDSPEDTTPTLIAGTDNVWVSQSTENGKQWHNPWYFKLDPKTNQGVNGELYFNTVDPDAEVPAGVVYGPNGLPVNTEDPEHTTEGWNYKTLHMYTQETCPDHEDMRKNKDDPKLYLANNNAFWGNSDSVYIPTEYAGKYLQCKVKAVCTEYYYMYDNLQTIASHVIKIEGPSVPEFDTITPGATDAELEKGVKNLGTFTVSPTFGFTYTNLAVKYVRAGYKVEPSINIRDVSTGENWNAVLTKEDCAEGYQVRYDLGRYAVRLKLTLIDPNGVEMDSRTMTYNMTLEYTPTITSMTPAPTAEELAAGVTDLGHLEEPVSFNFTYDDTPLPEWLAVKGYVLSAYTEIYQDGKLLGTVDAGTPWTPSAGGDRMVVFKVGVYSYQESKFISTASHTYKFTMDATDTGALSNLTAGQTDLGTVNAPASYWVELYPEKLPQWMQDQGYYMASKMDVVVDGTTVLHAIKGETYVPDRVGSYEIIREAQVYSDEGRVVERITEITTFTVPQQDITSIQFLNQDCTVAVEAVIAPEYEAAPAYFHKTPTLSLSSSDTAVVTVVNGCFKAVSDGTATVTIKCTETNTSYNFTITVYTPHDVYVGGIGLDYGEYLAQGSDTPTTTAPEDNYVYLYKNGSRSTLVMHNFSYIGKSHGVYSSVALTIELEGTNQLDMALSAVETSTYTYYGASGIVAPGFAINGTADDQLTIENYYVGIDNARSYNDVEFNGGNIIIGASYVGTAMSINYSDVYFYGSNITSYDGLYFGNNYVEIIAGEIYINTSRGPAWSTFKGYFYCDGGKVTAISTNNYGFSLDSSNTWEMMSGSVYAEGPWYGLDASTLDMTVADCQLLFVSTTETDDKKGPEDSYQGALYGTLTFSLGSNYAYGSMERFGTDGEVYDETKQLEYDFVFIGTDPSVFDVDVYTDAACSVEWDGTTALSSFETVQINHRHTMTYTKEIPATCLSSGVCAYWYCAGCGKYYAEEAGTTVIEDTTIAALDHDWIYPDCVNPMHCDRCGLVNETYQPYGHIWYPATCTEPMSCGRCSETVGGLIDHVWVEADCYYGTHCDYCGLETSDPLGHILEGEIIFVQQQPNCSWEIEAQQWCSRCEEYVWVNVKPDPSAHSWYGGDCVTPAQCEYCGVYSAESGHAWEEATCTTPKTCSVCSATEGSALEHNWRAASCANPKYCSICGETEGEALAHTWIDATCSDPKTCSVCYATEGDPLAHTLNEATCEHGATCTVCGWVDTAPAHTLVHVPAVAATCTTDGTVEHWTCSDCGALVDDEDGFNEITDIVAAATGHSWVDANCIDPKTCSSCGLTEGAALGHTFVDGVCSTCGGTQSVQPTLTLKYPSLSFESEILYNIYYIAENTDDVVEMGLATFDTELTDGTVWDATDVIPGFETDGSMWKVGTNGISAKNLGDTLYFKVYAKLSDGSYVYSAMKYYSAVSYANTILKRTTSSAYMKSLVVSMLNYGTEAQKYFEHRTDSLMNASLTADHQALVSAYDESMMDSVVAVDTTKAANFIYDGLSFARRVPTVSFDGAFAINYYFTAANAPDDGMTLYYWNNEDYTNASVLTVENATGSMEMVATDVANQYFGQVEGIAAKALDSTVFVVGVYEYEGVTYTTGVLNYSIGKYCEGIAAKDTSTQQAFARATAVYGYCAKEYFTNL